MANLRGTIWRLGIFLAVCAFVAFLTLAIFGQFRFGAGNSYYAEFSNVSNLRKGTIVRIAGVEVGKVENISINPDATVRVRVLHRQVSRAHAGQPGGDPVRQPVR